MIKVLTTGHFNLITNAHCYFLQEARKLGDHLTVFLDSDSRNEEKKADKSFLTFNQRCEILLSIRYVDEVVEFESAADIQKYLSQKDGYNNKLFVKGRDYDISKLDKYVLSVLDKNAVPIAFIPYLDGISTTNLIEKIKTGATTNVKF